MLSLHAPFVPRLQGAFMRGLAQVAVSSVLVSLDKTVTCDMSGLFGPSWYVRKMVFSRGFCSFLNLIFQLLAVERLPVGDASMLVMVRARRDL